MSKGSPENQPKVMINDSCLDLFWQNIWMLGLEPSRKSSLFAKEHKLGLCWMSCLLNIWSLKAVSFTLWLYSIKLLIPNLVVIFRWITIALMFQSLRNKFVFHPRRSSIFDVSFSDVEGRAGSLTVSWPLGMLGYICHVLWLVFSRIGSWASPA